MRGVAVPTNSVGDAGQISVRNTQSLHDSSSAAGGHAATDGRVLNWCPVIPEICLSHRNRCHGYGVLAFNLIDLFDQSAKTGEKRMALHLFQLLQC